MTEREQLEQTIAHLEAQRGILGDAAVNASIAALREKLAALDQTDPSRPAFLGERKLTTIMFADVSGFTAMAETLDPEAVRDLMNACFDRLVPIVEKYAGTVDKFIGDEIMAVFGAPTAHENDPERALRTALEMMDALAAFNAKRDTDLGMHIGINTGWVIAGGIGSEGRREYSVMGDAVNLASRLEDVSERGEILVGPDTYRLTAPLFEFEALEPVRVKGKAEPVPIYCLLAARAVPGRVRGIAGLESPLVGRQTELRALQQALEQLPDGRGGGIVTLVGEAGLGKSRLVAELRSQVAGAPLRWIEGRCLSYGGSIAYLLWLDLLRGLLGVSSEDAPRAVRDTLRERVEGLCRDEFDRVYPYLGRLLSLPLEDEVEAALQAVEGETLKAGTFGAVEILLQHVAQRHPLVLVCEDLHWADPTSVELLEHLLALVEQVPLLFTCIFRPEREHCSWRIREMAVGLYHHRHTDLWLAPLSAPESEALVGHLLHVEDLPPELRRRILAHAEGNPFYVEEIIRSLMDSEAIVRDQATDRWIATQNVADVAIPDTLQGVLLARIDRLQEEAKRVLQLAAVIGRVFLYRLLEAIAATGTDTTRTVAIIPVDEERDLEGKLSRNLLTLQREQMIRERAHLPELEYIFKHHLTQEAAYNGLLKKERRLFHRQVAEALERLFPERIEEQVGLLAYHWEQAGVAEKATAYLLRAGDWARIAYAHEEAIGFYERALVFLKEETAHEQAARTLMKLGLTCHNAFDFRRARQAYEEGFALWQRAGEAAPATPPSPAPHALRGPWYDPVTLDPVMAGDIGSGGVLAQLFSGLVELSLEMNILPDVAQRWEVLEGGRMYVFHLRDDVRWSDGAPVTAGDFEYTWKRALDPTTGSPNACLLYDIKGARAFHQGEVSDPDLVGVRTLDEVTLVVELEGPTGYFLQLLAHNTTYPVPRHVVEVHGKAWTEGGNLVTNGPFKLESWQRGKKIACVRNPDYHGRFRGNLQRAELDLRRDPATMLELYEAGRVDVLSLLDFPFGERDRIRQRHVGTYLSLPLLMTEYVGLNAERPPFDDVRVRRAFALAVDRERLAEEIEAGYLFPATGGFVPPGMPGHSAGIALPYDPAGARRLLAEAGYPDGRGFPDVAALASPGSYPQGEFLRSQWRENLGVDVTWETSKGATFFERVAREAPPIFLGGWSADYPDPDNFLRVSSAQRDTRWSYPDYDRLVEEARRVLDQQERIRLYQEADRILVQEAAIVPLSYGRWHLLLKPWVRTLPVLAVGAVLWKDLTIEAH